MSKAKNNIGFHNLINKKILININNETVEGQYLEK